MLDLFGEKKFSKNSLRRINIDPGYLYASKVILASTKDYSHRIYLSGGIFAEDALYYEDKSFQSWPWTYPDYKTKGYIEFFNNLRRVYLKQLNLKNKT